MDTIGIAVVAAIGVPMLAMLVKLVGVHIEARLERREEVRAARTTQSRLPIARVIRKI
jgi:hypothetical protein